MPVQSASVVLRFKIPHHPPHWAVVRMRSAGRGLAVTAPLISCVLLYSGSTITALNGIISIVIAKETESQTRLQ